VRGRTHTEGTAGIHDNKHSQDSPAGVSAPTAAELNCLRRGIVPIVRRKYRGPLVAEPGDILE
jgi:hypothetical protein